ncbi:O-antigen ligase family protein [Aureimonas populi]|uniref:O-antigen ligase family protein n=1 Tax=Aureimonas populi TaxID=1701758 RepID=A0ABW5CQ55_9HYPH|nr:O-antigen ligase [Aureimonas populi]
MRIARSSLFDPTSNGLYAATAVALSLFVFAYSSRFGPVAILVYYGLWLPLIALDPRAIIGRARDLVVPGIFVLVLVSSTLWSAAPGVSLRGSVQFATHALCILVAARVVSLRSLTRGVLVGTAIVTVYSLIFGYSAYDAMDGSYTFVGAFGSKNQLGLYCSLGIFFAMLSVFVMREPLLIRAGSVLLAALFALVLDASRSATSSIALAVAIMVFLALIALLRFGPMFRMFVVVLLLPASALVALAAYRLGAVELILAAFGKDPTLTGRTYLWEIGLQSFYQMPLAGIGYLAYWVPGFPEAEMLWAEFFITARTGFHFHNTIIQALVDVGIVGTVPLVIIVLSTLYRSLKGSVSRRSTADACLFALMVMFTIRSFSEVDFFYQYSLGSFILLYSYIKLGSAGSARQPVEHRRPYAPAAPAPLGRLSPSSS